MGWRERGATRKGIRGSKRVGGLRLPPSLSELRRTDPRCDLFHRSSELNNVSEGGRAVEWVLIKVGVHRRHVYGTQIIAAGEASRGRVAPRETTSRRASPKRSTETRHGPVMATPQRHRGVCANALERGRRRPRGAEPRAIISSRYARNGFQIVVPPNCSQKSILTDLIMNRSGNFFPCAIVRFFTIVCHHEVAPRSRRRHENPGRARTRSFARPLDYHAPRPAGVQSNYSANFQVLPI